LCLATADVFGDRKRRKKEYGGKSVS